MWLKVLGDSHTKTLPYTVTSLTHMCLVKKAFDLRRHGKVMLADGDPHPLPCVLAFHDIQGMFDYKDLMQKINSQMFVTSLWFWQSAIPRAARISGGHRRSTGWVGNNSFDSFIIIHIIVWFTAGRRRP